MNADRRTRARPASLPWPPQPPAPQDDDIAAIVKQLRAHLHASEHYALPEQRANFRQKMSALLDALEQRLAHLGQGAAAGDRAAMLRLRQEQAAWVTKFVMDASRQVRELTGGGFADVKAPFHEMSASAQRAQRRISLQIADDPAEIERTLYWMAEQGDEDDLFALRAAMRSALYSRGEIATLAVRAEKEIARRVYDPQRVAEVGEAAYLRRRDEWDRQYADKTIAVAHGEVVAYHSEKGEVLRRLFALQKEHGLFRAYVVEIGASVLDCDRARL